MLYSLFNFYSRELIAQILVHARGAALNPQLRNGQAPLYELTFTVFISGCRPLRLLPAAIDFWLVNYEKAIAHCIASGSYVHHEHLRRLRRGPPGGTP